MPVFNGSPLLLVRAGQGDMNWLTVYYRWSEGARYESHNHAFTSHVSWTPLSSYLSCGYNMVDKERLFYTYSQVYSFISVNHQVTRYRPSHRRPHLHQSGCVDTQRTILYILHVQPPAFTISPRLLMARRKIGAPKVPTNGSSSYPIIVHYALPSIAHGVPTIFRTITLDSFWF